MKKGQEIIFTILLLEFLNSAIATCGRERLTAKSWRQQYSNIGKSKRESCTWIFDSSIQDRSVLMLRIKSLTYTSSSAPSGFLTLPNGTRVNDSNKKRYVNKCMKFVRKGFKSRGCLDIVKDDFCSATIIETSIWPPRLSSSVVYSYINRAGSFYYPMRFVYEYSYLECPNGTYGAFAAPSDTVGSDNYYVSTIALSILMVLFFLIAAVASSLLWKKTRKPTPQEKSFVLSGKSSSSNSSSNSKKDESVYENPSNMETELISNRNPYSHIVSSSTKAEDDNSTYAIIPAASRPSEVVKNVLYHSYENTKDIPVAKQVKS